MLKLKCQVVLTGLCSLILFPSTKGVDKKIKKIRSFRAMNIGYHDLLINVNFEPLLRER